MGPVGLTAAAAGGVVFALGQRAIAASLSGLSEPLARAADERLGKLNRAAVVVGVAVAIYLIARSFGHGHAGLYTCVALLLVNAAVVAALRIRWMGELGAPPEVTTPHRRGSLLQMAGAFIGFLGCAIYLLRP